MGLEGATIVSRHVLDDTDLRRGLLANENLLRTHQRRTEPFLAFDTQKAQRSVRALSDAMILFGGTSTFAVLQIGRLSVSLAKLASSYHSVAVAATAMTAAEVGSLRAQAAGLALARANMARRVEAAGGVPTAVQAASEASLSSRQRALEATIAGGAGGAAAKAGLGARAAALVTSPAAIVGGSALAIAAAVDATQAYVRGTESLTSRLWDWGKSVYAAATGADKLAAAQAALTASEELLAAKQSNMAAAAFVEETDPRRVTERGRAVIANTRRERAETSAAFLRDQLAVGADNTRRAVEEYIDRTISDRSTMMMAEHQTLAWRKDQIADVQARISGFDREDMLDRASQGAFSFQSRDASQFRFGFKGGDLIGQQTGESDLKRLLKDHREQERREAETQLAELQKLNGETQANINAFVGFP